MKTKLRLDAHQRLDAPTSAFLAQQLEQIRPQTYDTVFPEFLGRSLVPINNSIDPGVQQYTFTYYTEAGVAAYITDYAKDLPRVGLKAEQGTTTFRSIGISYGWSYDEIDASRFTGQPLDSKLPLIAKRAVERQIDESLTIGDPGRNMLGLFTQPITGVQAVGTYTRGTATAYNLATAIDVVDDLNAAMLKVRTITKDAESVTDIVLPLSMAGIATRRLDPADSTTILAAFLATAPGVNVSFHLGLETAGAGATRRIVMYKKSTDKLEGLISREFTQEAPEIHSLSVDTPCRARVGGVVVYLPKSVQYIDNV